MRGKAYGNGFTLIHYFKSKSRVNQGVVFLPKAQRAA
jgi:hypothetical protein